MILIFNETLYNFVKRRVIVVRIKYDIACLFDLFDGIGNGDHPDLKTFNRIKHKAQFYPGSQEKYQIAIRFCAGGLSNLYRDWFEGKLDMTLAELTDAAQKFLSGVMMAFA